MPKRKAEVTVPTLLALLLLEGASFMSYHVCCKCSSSRPDPFREPLSELWTQATSKQHCQMTWLSRAQDLHNDSLPDHWRRQRATQRKLRVYGCLAYFNNWEARPLLACGYVLLRHTAMAPASSIWSKPHFRTSPCPQLWSDPHSRATPYTQLWDDPTLYQMQEYFSTDE